MSTVITCKSHNWVVLMPGWFGCARCGAQANSKN